MSDISKKFYNFFWQDRSCRNLFLLSKVELLDTTTVGEHANAFTYSSPRIIISNAHNNEDYATIKIRTENLNIHLDGSIEERINYFKPIIEQFLDTKFKKSVEKLIADIESKPIMMLGRIFKILAKEETREKKSISFLQSYGFIGMNVDSFKDIELNIKSS